MKNKLLKYILLISMSVCISAPMSLGVENASEPASDFFAQESETVDNQISTIQPKSIEKKSEAKTVMLKFLYSMLLVGGSCVFIFFILLVYKKLKTKKEQPSEKIDISQNLNTPETMEDALRFFIEKF